MLTSVKSDTSAGGIRNVGKSVIFSHFMGEQTLISIDGRQVKNIADIVLDEINDIVLQSYHKQAITRGFQSV